MHEEQLKQRLNEIDKILDDESISDDEFNELEDEARRIVEELGKIECKRSLNNVDELKNVSQWTKDFLNSFDCGTRTISIRQAQVFEKLNKRKPFKFNGRRFDCSGPNYRTGFGTLIVTNL